MFFTEGDIFYKLPSGIAGFSSVHNCNALYKVGRKGAMPQSTSLPPPPTPSLKLQGKSPSIIPLAWFHCICTKWMMIVNVSVF